MADMDKVKRNIKRMLESGSTESEINEYLSIIGVKLNDLGGQVQSKTPQRVMELTSGINYEGIANALGAPVDGTAWLMNQTGIGVDNPVGGSDSIRDLFGLLGIEDHKPTDATGRVLRNVGKEIGVTTASAGLPIAFASRAIGPAKNAKGVLTRAFAGDANKALTGARGYTGYMAGENAIGSAAGLGEGALTEVAGAGPTNSIIGQVGGASTLAALSTLWSTNRSLMNKLSPTGVSKRAANKVKQQLIDNGEIPKAVGEQILDGMDDYASIDDFRPLTADLTDSQSLARLNRGIAVNDPVRHAQSKTANKMALRNSFDSTNPNATRNGDSDGASIRLRDQIEANQSDFKNQAKKLYNAVDPDGSISVDVNRIRSLAQDLMGQQETLAGSAQFPSKVVEQMLNTGPEVKFSTLRQFRQNVNAEIKAAKVAGRGGEVEILQQIKNRVDDILQSVESQAGEAANRLRQANEYYASNAPRFNNGTTGRILRKNNAGDPVVRPSKTGPRYMGDGEEGADSLLKALDNDPQLAIEYAWKAMDEKVTDADGFLVPSKLRSFLDGNQRFLNRVYQDNPEHLERIKLVSKAIGNMDRSVRLSQTVPGSATAQNQSARALAGTVLDTLVTGGTPGTSQAWGLAKPLWKFVSRNGAMDNIIQDAMLDPALMASLLRRADDPSALQPLIDYATKTASQTTRTAIFE